MYIVGKGSRAHAIIAGSRRKGGGCQVGGEADDLLLEVHLRAVFGIDLQAFFRGAMHARFRENFERAIGKLANLFVVNYMEMTIGADGLQRRGCRRHSVSLILQ